MKEKKVFFLSEAKENFKKKIISKVKIFKYVIFMIHKLIFLDFVFHNLSSIKK